MVINYSGERLFPRFKRIKTALNGRNVPGEVVHIKCTKLNAQASSSHTKYLK